jgi:hypothetical protein
VIGSDAHHASKSAGPSTLRLRFATLRANGDG